jgi:hypothetical protein
VGILFSQRAKEIKNKKGTSIYKYDLSLIDQWVLLVVEKKEKGNTPRKKKASKKKRQKKLLYGATSRRSRSYARIFSPCSYDIIFCVSFLNANHAVDFVYSWSSLEWYSNNIHANSSDKVYPKRLNIF